ncbi:hypothetical protein [Pandoraea terrae]|uniref:hypothetical protein n=1 Tax=Pandoraea terrae TaxID=1537710 RepID=UPI00123EE6EC|nr:hypothetical protein [Pandoraea terrae]
MNKPAYYCSGVLLRPLRSGSADVFWQPQPVETALGSVPFTYLRRDVAISSLPSSAGFIFMDTLTAAGQGKPFDVRCAYPLDVTLTEGVADHGCALSANLAQNVDPSSCAPLGVTDAPTWLAYYAAQGKQCSLSALDARQFKSSLEAHNAVAEMGGANINAMLVTAWDVVHPETVPVQALFYDIGHGGQLSQPQRYQKQYFDATGQWLPILRLFFAEDGQASFGYDVKDQLDYGYQVAGRLNARYTDTAPQCPGGDASLYCNGVVIRVTGYGTAFHSWNPSPGAIARNGVAFSYLRVDGDVTAIAYAGGVGLIMRELAAPVQTPLTARCIYPSDGATDARADRCGIRDSDLSRPCADLGITTLDAWRANYAITTWSQQCSFDVDQAAFQLSLEARATFPKPHIRQESWNELIITPWRQDIPTQIPIEAIFYTGAKLPGAQYIQQDYLATTGRFLPIVHVDMNAPPGQIFTYAPNDQATSLFGDLPAPSGATFYERLN